MRKKGHEFKSDKKKVNEEKNEPKEENGKEGRREGNFTVREEKAFRKR